MSYYRCDMFGFTKFARTKHIKKFGSLILNGKCTEVSQTVPTLILRLTYCTIIPPVLLKESYYMYHVTEGGENV